MFMLPEKSLTSLSVLALSLGLVCLYITSIFVEPRYVEISEITREDLGEIIKTKGNISEAFLSEKSNTLFLSLEGKGGKIKVVRFNVGGEEFEEGETVSVEGEVSVYEGELEIVAKRIEKIN